MYPPDGDLAGDAGQPQDGMENPEDRAVSVHEAQRMKKAFHANAKAIQNRIHYFKREEEKIWRDLEEVRRQASKIEDGRSRAMERRMATKNIQTSREAGTNSNRLRAAHQKANTEAIKKEQAYEAVREKKDQWTRRRQEAAEMLRHKKMLDAQARLRNSERAVSVQKQKLEAQLKVNQQRGERLKEIRIQQELARRDAEDQVTHVEQSLPLLEAEELLCVQRLQNSRIVTQSVLQELEQSLGARSPVASLLRSKAQQRSINVGEVPVDGNGDQDFGETAAPETFAPPLRTR
jgi:hypothetical protein